MYLFSVSYFTNTSVQCLPSNQKFPCFLYLIERLTILISDSVGIIQGIYLTFLTFYPPPKKSVTLLSWFRIYQLHPLQKGKTPPLKKKGVLSMTTVSDSDFLILELCKMWSHSSLALLPGPI